MKKLIIILLLISFQSQAQNNDAWKRLILFSGSIALDATADAMYDNGDKELAHFMKAASIGVTLSIPLFVDVKKDTWLWYLASYTFIRFAIFDYTYNSVRGLPLDYMGNTSGYDKFMRQQHSGVILFGKAIFLTAGIAINFNEL